MENISRFILLCAISLSLTNVIYAQEGDSDSANTQAIYTLIAKYAEAREKKDLQLLDTVFATEIDQLTSSGEWRSGKG